MKKIILSIFFLLPLLLTAQSNVGTAGFMFLMLSPTAKTAAMGNATTAIADDGSALWSNPAGIAMVRSVKVEEGDSVYYRRVISLAPMKVSISGTKYVSGIYHTYFGVSYPISQSIGTVGLQAIYLGTDAMDETAPPGFGYPVDELGRTGRTFKAGEMALGLSYARMLTDKFSVGLSIKYIQSQIHDFSASNVVMDIGMMYDTHFKSIMIGIAMLNFGGSAKYITQDFNMPMDFRFGLSFVPFKSGANKILIDTEVSHPNHSEDRFFVGAEYSFNDMMFLRLGLKPGFYTKEEYDAEGQPEVKRTYLGEEQISTGAGFRIPMGPKTSVSIDYAFTKFEFLGNVHRFSLGAQF
ncbi:PorV/PorQ family protein [candidate division WOR-3 bacterium]|nr:PorV/PorQ family protein [candidate division WOR-3 bacterium]